MSVAPAPTSATPVLLTFGGYPPQQNKSRLLLREHAAGRAKRACQSQQPLLVPTTANLKCMFTGRSAQQHRGGWPEDCKRLKSPTIKSTATINGYSTIVYYSAITSPHQNGEDIFDPQERHCSAKKCAWYKRAGRQEQTRDVRVINAMQSIRWPILCAERHAIYCTIAHLGYHAFKVVVLGNALSSRERDCLAIHALKPCKHKKHAQQQQKLWNANKMPAGTRMICVYGVLLIQSRTYSKNKILWTRCSQAKPKKKAQPQEA